MSRADAFDFSGDAVAAGYDEVLVPALFRPWAERLVAEHGPWEGRRVLDLATGTGIVAELLAESVGPGGHVVAADINPDMLALASRRCEHASGQITFVECPAHPLDVGSESVDVAVCQQGFQFFPDQRSAAAELHRVLRGGGRAIASCWQGVDRCQLFGAVCDTLDSMGEAETADLMRRPFVQDGPELRDRFAAAGFVDVTLGEAELPLAVGSTDAAVDLAFATPIGPRLREMPEDRRDEFRSALAERVDAMNENGNVAGTMVSHLLTARKP